MARAIPCSGLLALGLIAAMPSSAMAQNLPRILSPGCPLVALPDPERFCQTLDRTSAPGGMTLVVGSGGRSEMVDSDRVAATFGLNGPTILRSSAAPVVAHSRDIGTTGSIAPDARR